MFNRNDYFSNSVRHAEGGTVVAVRSTDRGKARSSPTQRKYFVCNYCFAGACHNHQKVAYKLNSLGLPEKVILYIKERELPSAISLDKIDDEFVYEEEYGHVRMAYDESGTRIWERTYT